MDSDISDSADDQGSSLTDDELEAKSIKYNIARIVRLSSGAVALFSPFDNDEGIRLIHIGTLESVAAHIPTADECASFVVAARDTEPMSKADRAEAIDLLSALGLAKPPSELKRRI